MKPIVLLLKGKPPADLLPENSAIPRSIDLSRCSDTLTEPHSSTDSASRLTRMASLTEENHGYSRETIE
ncbi:uncharacterized protein BO72DRAFT_446469 [Aspergillus fijiensis CBS 313.89]|uniref:Uncharacterized protein n=1 Tax=Aspergillus fijiensis CBS 313.89 TaxID=1448319 RepID=A0A8G1RTY4_9EURO|nr:uncharacterized protein BO72DRAFT_446469 [Aspergillus fijiensis CBS 313.89]RAK79194.1 hypothetical protein BO72DRAFT_446469 [Aspergillus fijiensis CBS 313.89]